MTLANGKTIEGKVVRASAPPASYLALIQQFPLWPIKSEAELDRATAVMNALVDRADLDRAEEGYLDVLSDLVERYEDKHHPIPTDDLSDAEMLEHLIEAKDVTQAAVARATGIAGSTISEVLAGKRQLTRAQIGKLASYFHVSPAVFMTAAGIRRKHAKDSHKGQ
jgi:HTH-type transcriptional regulator / antitoxin HigA